MATVVLNEELKLECGETGVKSGKKSKIVNTNAPKWQSHNLVILTRKNTTSEILRGLNSSARANLTKTIPNKSWSFWTMAVQMNFENIVD